MQPILRHILATAAFIALQLSSAAAIAGTAYLEISLKVDPQDRPTAVSIYRQYRHAFLREVPGAKSMLIRQSDVQVLHGFATSQQAHAYLTSEFFAKHLAMDLKPLLKAEPQVRIYSSP